MRKRELQQFEGLLTQKIDRLIDKAVGMMGGDGAMPVRAADPSDRASLEAESNFSLRVRDRERKLILKARRALDRIKDGSYGYCDNCGEPINKSRLRARPEASLCIECKREMEERERRAKMFR